MVGAFLTFVLAIGDYITPQILGGNRELLMPQAIMLQIGRQADFPMAAAMSLILMLVVGLAYLACARWLRLERVMIRRTWQACWLPPISALAYLFIFLPVLVLILFSFQGSAVPVPPFNGPSLRWYAAVLADGRLLGGPGPLAARGRAVLAARDLAGLPRRLRPGPRIRRAGRPLAPGPAAGAAHRLLPDHRHGAARHLQRAWRAALAAGGRHRPRRDQPALVLRHPATPR